MPLCCAVRPVEIVGVLPFVRFGFEIDITITITIVAEELIELLSIRAMQLKCP